VDQAPGQRFEVLENQEQPLVAPQLRHL
jgi:hypothetical protein